MICQRGDARHTGWATLEHGRRLISAAIAGLILWGGSALAQLAGPPRVIDGDTLEVAGQRVRLSGIDAPELEQVCQHAGRDYPCGKVARAALWDLVAGLDVSCEPDDAAPEPDGSILATCTAGDFSLNEHMVYAGWALADPQASGRYQATQAAAEQARRGLWRGGFDPPREWRQAPSGRGSDPADAVTGQ